MKGSCWWADAIGALDGPLQLVLLVCTVKTAGVAAGLKLGHPESAANSQVDTVIWPAGELAAPDVLTAGFGCRHKGV